jgi:hypothetical protein
LTSDILIKFYDKNLDKKLVSRMSITKKPISVFYIDFSMSLHQNLVKKNSRISKLLMHSAN